VLELFEPKFLNNLIRNWLVMSAIYRTLKKLRHPLDEGNKRAMGLKKGKNIYSFHKKLFSPVGSIVLVGVVLIAISVGLVSYGKVFIGELAVRNDEDIVVSKKKSIEHFPARLKRGYVMLSRRSVKKLQQHEMVKEENDPAGAGFERLPEGYSGPIEETRAKQLVKSKAKPQNGTKDKVCQTDGEELDLSEKGADPKKHGDLESKSQNVAKARKPTKVMHLVSKIETAIAAKEMSRARVFIDKLAALKGEHDVYVLKLMAFWYMDQGDFDKAFNPLTEALDKYPDDLEAGINMAIVEMKEKRFGKAKERLVGLRDIYPVSTMVERLLQKLGD